MASEVINNARTVQSFCAEGKETDRYKEGLEKHSVVSIYVYVCMMYICGYVCVETDRYKEGLEKHSVVSIYVCMYV